MPKTTKIVKIDDTLAVEQATLKRGTKVAEKQTKNDIDSSLMTFFKIVLSAKSELMINFITDVNSACENLATSLSDEYDVEVFDNLSGDGFFTEVIEGMKKHCQVALEKVQSDARRTVLIDTDQVPAELWESDGVVTSSSGVSNDVQALLATMKK